VGRIASFYNLSYKTISVFAKHLEDEKVLAVKIKALLQILTQAAEFENLPIREGEESLLASIS
jgi:pre-mRNA-splicing helicase BRR2